MVSMPLTCEHPNPHVLICVLAHNPLRRRIRIVALAGGWLCEAQPPDYPLVLREVRHVEEVGEHHDEPLPPIHQAIQHDDEDFKDGCEVEDGIAGRRVPPYVQGPLGEVRHNTDNDQQVENSGSQDIADAARGLQHARRDDRREELGRAARHGQEGRPGDVFGQLEAVHDKLQGRRQVSVTDLGQNVEGVQHDKRVHSPAPHGFGGFRTVLPEKQSP
mmetsp:Transcript_460/g.2041  ORF Transcript_460/g.2041 Transcript_460/m.2041 type:complete len:217 (-) Transcript_460:68-718(-)